jgi:hypothetical protein
MNTMKLTEALAELKQQQKIIEAAIENLEKIIVALGSNSPVISPVVAPAASQSANSKRSYIDDVEQILASVGQRLHIKEISRRISDMRGKSVPRTSIEASVIRHINELKDRARIAKVAPSTYDLPSRRIAPTA